MIHYLYGDIIPISGESDFRRGQTVRKGKRTNPRGDPANPQVERQTELTPEWALARDPGKSPRSCAKFMQYSASLGNENYVQHGKFPVREAPFQTKSFSFSCCRDVRGCRTAPL